MDKNYWIEKLELQVHPDGGYYKEFYRSKDIITSSNINEQRSSSTSIYYLLESETKSFCHKLKSDEIWYYHHGASVTLFLIDQEGNLSIKICGKGEGKDLCVLIPKNTWFGARVMEPNAFALVSCMVSPGFEFTDLEIADRNELIKIFPQHKESIIKYTLM